MAPLTRRASTSQRKASTQMPASSAATSPSSPFVSLKVSKSIQSSLASTVSKNEPVERKKRRRSEVEAVEDEEASRYTSRTWSNDSNPASRTRAKRRMLRTILDDSDLEDFDATVVESTTATTEVDQMEMQVPSPIEATDSTDLASQDSSITPIEAVTTSVVIETKVEETHVEIAQNSQITVPNVSANQTQVANIAGLSEPNGSTMPGQAAAMAAADGEGVPMGPMQPATIMFGMQQSRSMAISSAQPLQKKGPARSRKGVIQKKVSTEKTKITQTKLNAHLVKQEPHPESKIGKFKITKLKYATPSNFGMPLSLMKVMTVHEGCLDKDGNIKLRKHYKLWDNKKLQFKFGFSPYLRLLDPTEEQCRAVWALLDPWLRSQDPPIVIEATGTAGAQGPAHGTAGLTIGSFVKTILAQATSNPLAIETERICAARFPFFVNGKKVVSETPNYHAMHAASHEQVQRGIKRGGLYVGKAKAIKAVMQAVYDMNLKTFLATNDGVVPVDHELGQKPETSTFVPGMLSLDFLYEMKRESLLEWLVNLDGISHKTAACIMEFNFGYPICAVDVHVNKMAKFLNWVPRNFSYLSTFRHLEGRIPDELKHLLHQGFWHHSQKCKRCKFALARDDPGKVDMEPCPIEYLVVRFKPKPAPPKKKKSAASQNGQEDVGPADYKPWDAYENEEAAAEDGYEATDVPMNDDFAAGSSNVSMNRGWVYVGIEDEEAL